MDLTNLMKSFDSAQFEWTTQVVNSSALSRKPFEGVVICNPRGLSNLFQKSFTSGRFESCPLGHRDEVSGFSTCGIKARSLEETHQSMLVYTGRQSIKFNVRVTWTTCGCCGDISYGWLRHQTSSDRGHGLVVASFLTLPFVLLTTTKTMNGYNSLFHVPIQPEFSNANDVYFSKYNAYIQKHYNSAILPKPFWP